MTRGNIGFYDFIMRNEKKEKPRKGKNGRIQKPKHQVNQTLTEEEIRKYQMEYMYYYPDFWITEDAIKHTKI